jgi:hypothetical protein
VSPRAGFDGCGKSRPPPVFDPRTVQPVASRYTDHDPSTIFLHSLSRVLKMKLKFVLVLN